MADLPDLNTENISYVAYWNAIDDGGADSINPEDALSSGNINSYTLYDNGYTFKYQSPNGRVVNGRIKTDGWIVVWIDTSEEYRTTTTNPPRGPWDVIRNWKSDADPDFSYGNLDACIDNIQSQLDNTNAITFNNSDVGFYNYKFPDASATTVAAVLRGDYDGNNYGGFSYTSETTIKRAWACGYLDVHGGPSNSVRFENNILVSTSDSNDTYTGSLSLTDNYLIPDANTEYQASVRADNTRRGNVCIQVAWE